jgi:hypothetical protein
MAYLSAAELANLVGCRTNSYACMRRWLTKNGWPFVVNLRGFPNVSRRYHDARMIGALKLDPRYTSEDEPDFSMFPQ